MNTIGSHTSLGDLIAYNTPAQPAAAQTTVADAQSTLAQSPATIVSALAPSNTYYGVAPANDSLLGNVATSAALSALSQINGSRAAADQVSPYGSGTDAASAAVADAQQTRQNAQSTSWLAWKTWPESTAPPPSRSLPKTTSSTVPPSSPASRHR